MKKFQHSLNVIGLVASVFIALMFIEDHIEKIQTDGISTFRHGVHIMAILGWVFIAAMSAYTLWRTHKKSGQDKS